LNCAIWNIWWGLQENRVSKFDKTVQIFQKQVLRIGALCCNELHVHTLIKIYCSSILVSEKRIIDMEYHLPFLCFSVENILLLLSCILTQQRIIFLASNYSLLTPITEVRRFPYRRYCDGEYNIYLMDEQYEWFLRIFLAKIESPGRVL
jgi:hypothetical protein